MSNTESFNPGFNAAAVFPVGAGRVIWCRSVASPLHYFRAQLEPPVMNTYSVTEERWKIALLKLDAIPVNGRPSAYEVVKYLSAPVKSEHGSYVRQSETFSYSKMMEIMTGLYNPSTHDPLERFPNHISDEIREWRAVQRRAEREAREEWTLTHK